MWKRCSPRVSQCVHKKKKKQFTKPMKEILLSEGITGWGYSHCCSELSCYIKDSILNLPQCRVLIIPALGKLHYMTSLKSAWANWDPVTTHTHTQTPKTIKSSSLAFRTSPSVPALYTFWAVVSIKLLRLALNWTLNLQSSRPGQILKKLKVGLLRCLSKSECLLSTW